MKRLYYFLFLLVLYSCTPKVDEAYMTLLESQVATSNRQLPIDVGGLSYFLVELDKESATLTHSYQYPNNPQISQDQKKLRNQQ